MSGLYSIGQMNEHADALERNGWTPADVKKASGGDILTHLLPLVRAYGEVPVVPAQPKPEPVLDFLVRVDRSVKPSYPDWFKKLEHPELECSGPAEYDLQTAVQQWLHDDQKNGVVVGNTIYKHLKKDNALVSCLNLQDGLAIQQKGIAVFRKLFAGKAVFLWGSVVQNRSGGLSVPFLCEFGGEVVVGWGWLDSNWFSSFPALRFSK